MASWNPPDGFSLEDINTLTKFHPQNKGFQLSGWQGQAGQEPTNNSPRAGVGRGARFKRLQKNPNLDCLESRAGIGRGARFKHLQMNSNQSFCITREIENAFGTAHRLLPSTAQLPAIKQGELVQGTSRGWIPQEFSEESMEEHLSAMEDLVDTDLSVVETDPSIVETDLSAMEDLLETDPSVVETDASVVETDPSVVETDLSVMEDIVHTNPGIVELQEMASSEMGDPRYITAPSSMKSMYGDYSPNESFHNADTAMEVEDAEKKSRWGNYCQIL